MWSAQIPSSVHSSLRLVRPCPLPRQQFRPDPERAGPGSARAITLIAEPHRLGLSQTLGRGETTCPSGRARSYLTMGSAQAERSRPWAEPIYSGSAQSKPSIYRAEPRQIAGCMWPARAPCRLIGLLWFPVVCPVPLVCSDPLWSVRAPCGLRISCRS